MNILLAISTPDGADYLVFELETLNMDLKHHKSIYNAVVFALSDKKKEYKKRKANKVFSKNFGLSVSYGEILCDGYFITDILRAEGPYSDSEAEEYDHRYRNLSLETPVQIDEVLKVKTFY